MAGFETVRARPLTIDENAIIIANSSLFIEDKYMITFTYQAILELAESAEYYFPEGVSSDKAMDLLNEIAPWAKRKGYKYVDIVAPELPKGKDRVVATDINSTIWARFYEIGTNRPFFSGRDSEKKYDLKEVELERRTGYAWYGTWPATLLVVEYPKWLQKLNTNN